MDPITQQTTLASAGGKKDPLYVDDVFSTFLYDGTGSAQTNTNGIDLSGEGGLVWIKSRDYSQSNRIFDTERGVGETLRSNGTEGSIANASTITSFNNNGFTLGTDANGFGVNETNRDYVSWTFRKAPGFFDIVTYTGTGSAKTVAHNLGSVPGMIIIKDISGSSNWVVYHRSGATSQALYLNSNNLFSNSSGFWNNTAPTSSVFTVGADGYNTNNTNSNYVAYIFAHDNASFGTDEDESIIKCGSVANNGGQVTEVNLGFEPQFILIKNATATEDWHIFDVTRKMDITKVAKLWPNKDTYEDVSGYPIVYPTATGFTVTTASAGDWVNGTYIYMAIRRPHKPPEAATEVFAIDYGNSSSTIPCWDSGFPVDFALAKEYSASANWWTIARLTGSKLLQPNLTNAEANGGTSWVSDSMTGWGKSYSSNYLSWMFKRAPGFFDVVAYTGTGFARTINHNLGAVPSVVLIKGRNTTYSWYWQHYALGANTLLQLNNDEVSGSNGNVFNSTLPTSSVFSVGSLAGANGSGNSYIAYLFADLPGISKAGTYTGTGNAINVDCGFTNGARFVLIKRTDASGSWYLWDSARGIVSGNDPYLLVNGNYAQSTGGDYIDPLPAGFTLTATAATATADISASGGTYLFLAIA